MATRRTGSGPKRQRSRGVILEKLVGNLLKYSQRLVKRIGLRNVAISAQLHQGHVVKVTHCTSTTFAVPSASEHDRAGAAPAYDLTERGLPAGSLTPDAINAMLGLRLNRLLRHFGIRFGALHIEVDDDGTISTMCPSPPLRPAELRDVARALSKLSPEKSPHASAATGSVVVKPSTRRELRIPVGGRRHGGAMV